MDGITGGLPESYHSLLSHIHIIRAFDAAALSSALLDDLPRLLDTSASYTKVENYLYNVKSSLLF